MKETEDSKESNSSGAGTIILKAVLGIILIIVASFAIWYIINATNNNPLAKGLGSIMGALGGFLALPAENCSPVTDCGKITDEDTCGGQSQCSWYEAESTSKTDRCINSSGKRKQNSFVRFVECVLSVFTFLGGVVALAIYKGVLAKDTDKNVKDLALKEGKENLQKYKQMLQ